ncbi:hypothetical protein C8J57DRAFT_1222725 [Mycena rebaudengoi]|nr:hypothetical protein C8J57DRAFT_1222725 [Mycena rebaudengoi]
MELERATKAPVLSGHKGHRKNDTRGENGWDADSSPEPSNIKDNFDSKSCAKPMKQIGTQGRRTHERKCGVNLKPWTRIWQQPGPNIVSDTKVVDRCPGTTSVDATKISVYHRENTTALLNEKLKLELKGTPTPSNSSRKNEYGGANGPVAGKSILAWAGTKNRPRQKYATHCVDFFFGALASAMTKKRDARIGPAENRTHGGIGEEQIQWPQVHAPNTVDAQKEWSALTECEFKQGFVHRGRTNTEAWIATRTSKKSGHSDRTAKPHHCTWANYEYSGQISTPAPVIATAVTEMVRLQRSTNTVAKSARLHQQIATAVTKSVRLHRSTNTVAKSARLHRQINSDCSDQIGTPASKHEYSGQIDTPASEINSDCSDQIGTPASKHEYSGQIGTPAPANK